MEEVYVPPTSILLQTTNDAYSKKELINMERNFLKLL